MLIKMSGHQFSIDNHTLSVIAADFVPITPFTTESVTLGMGQRYVSSLAFRTWAMADTSTQDIIVTANATSDNYWMRAVPQTTCSENDNSDNIRGIVRYDSSSTTDPTSTGYDIADDCDDMPMASLVPYVALDAGSESTQDELGVSFTTVGSFFRWTIGGSVSLSIVGTG